MASRGQHCYLFGFTEKLGACVCYLLPSQLWWWWVYVGVWWCLNEEERKKEGQVDNRKKENKEIAADRWAKGGKLKHCNLLPS